MTFEAPRKEDLHINLKKCEFFKELEYLCFIVPKKGWWCMNPNKV
jgi:hypothetical protein